MRLFCDTSVLVAACIRHHPHYVRARPVLESIARKSHEGCISAHSLAETYSALTSAPLNPRILSAEAGEMVATNLRRHFRIIPVGGALYDKAMRNCIARGLAGGHVYDALLIECARRSDAERILTFNLRDFRRLAPDLDDRLAAP